MAASVEVSGKWTRLRTLGRGASGAVVSLAADGASGELFAVKSATASAAAAALRRERAVMSGLRSPHVLRCIGAGEEPDGTYHLYLEYAPGGSLADEAARNGGRLGERAVRAYAADAVRGLAYLHARSVVHGDVKAANVVIGGDGRAKLADFGCARQAAARPRGGTPAFMAPEVARGEERQLGPAADVWALGCTVVEMATGRAPWGDADDGVHAALHRIGYADDAVPEVPAWLSADAKRFLARCFVRNAADRATAGELLEHPFLVTSPCHDADSVEWVSPKSTLDAAFWESEDTDDEAEGESPAGDRIKSLACSSLPDWDCEESGWIDVLCGAQAEAVILRSAPSQVSSTSAVLAPETGVGGASVISCDHDEDATEDALLLPFGAVVEATATAAAPGPSSVGREENNRCSSSECHLASPPFQGVHVLCNGVDAIKLRLTTNFNALLCFNSPRWYSALA